MSDLASAAAALTAIDPEIQGRMKSLVHLAIDQAEYIMHHGAPPLQMQLVKALMPAMVKEMARQKEGDGQEELRREMAAVMAEVRGGTTGASEMEEDLHGGATEDVPVRVKVTKEGVVV